MSWNMLGAGNNAHSVLKLRPAPDPAGGRRRAARVEHSALARRPGNIEGWLKEAQAGEAHIILPEKEDATGACDRLYMYAGHKCREGKRVCNGVGLFEPTVFTDVKLPMRRRTQMTQPTGPRGGLCSRGSV
jgi:hypothetical protein